MAVAFPPHMQRSEVEAAEREERAELSILLASSCFRFRVRLLLGSSHYYSYSSVRSTPPIWMNGILGSSSSHYYSYSSVRSTSLRSQNNEEFLKNLLGHLDEWWNEYMIEG
jgi:hypothetical protein